MGPWSLDAYLVGRCLCFSAAIFPMAHWRLCKGLLKAVWSEVGHAFDLDTMTDFFSIDCLLKTSEYRDKD